MTEVKRTEDLLSRKVDIEIFIIMCF